MSSWKIDGRRIEFQLLGSSPAPVGVGLLNKRQLSEFEEALDYLVDRAREPAAAHHLSGPRLSSDADVP